MGGQMLGQNALYDYYPPVNTTPPDLYAEDNEYPVIITDDHGNYYSPDDVKVKAQSNTCVWPPNSSDAFGFQVDFFDDNGFGFDGPNGPDAINVVCQALLDISNMLQSSVTCDEPFNEPFLRIKVDTSFNTDPTPGGGVALGFGGSFYFNYSNPSATLPSFRHNSVWRNINGGEDPLGFPFVIGEDYYHAQMRFNFNDSINWNFDMNDTTFVNDGSTNSYDFYQVVLHELMHVLGISSGINLTNNNDSTTYIYNRFDKYLVNHNNSDTPLLSNTDGCYGITYTEDPNAILGGCSSVHFVKGALDIPITTHSDWSLSSLSHFGNDTCSTDLYLMLASINNGTPIRRPTSAEVEALCAIGYATTGTYGDGTLPFHTANNGIGLPACGEIAAGVDNDGGFCNDNEYVFSACDIIEGDSLTIFFLHILHNDVNVNDSIDVNCIEPVLGNITFSTDVDGIYITNASIGLNVLRYLPTHATTGEDANPTFIYFYLEPCQGGCDEFNNCNAICNPSMVNQCDTTGIFSYEYASPGLSLSDLDECLFMEGWNRCTESPNYYFGIDPTSSLDSFPGPDGVIGMWASSVTDETESVVVPININGGEDYILSFYHLISSEVEGYSSSLDELYFTLFNLEDIGQLCGTLPFFNDIPDLSIPNQQIYIDSNLTNFDTWNYHTTCFQPDTNYNMLLIHGIQDADDAFSYYLIDEVSITPDLGLAGDSLVITCCTDTTLVAGDSCIVHENITYLWEQYDAPSDTWSVIPGADLPFLTTDTICNTICLDYRVVRYIDPDFAYPNVGNFTCIADTAYFNVCSDCVAPIACPDQINYVVPQLNPFNNIAIDTVDGKAAYIVPSSAVWNAANNDFLSNPNFTQIANTPVFMNIDLVIPSGVELVINPINMFFDPDCRILVQRGGILRLDGQNELVHLGGICDTMWQGIQVEGPGRTNTRTTDALGNPISYGKLYSSQVLIEDALFGMANTKFPLIDVNTIATSLLSFPDYTAGGLSNAIFNNLFYSTFIASDPAIDFSGGIIRLANDTTEFYNCLEGIIMPWYRNLCNNSLQENCECLISNAFIHSDALVFPFDAAATPSITETGIHLIDYRPSNGYELPIDNNAIQNCNYAIKGIHLVETDITNNNIERCNAGISILNAVAAFEIQDLLISQNELDNCSVAMQLARMEGEVTYNNINNNYTPADILNMNDIGIFMMGSASSISHNRVYYTNMGVALLSNQTTPVEVRNNIFFNNIIGVDALGDNMAAQITCNDFDQYYFAILVREYFTTLGTYVNQLGMTSEQGNCDEFNPAPADNLFIQPLYDDATFEVYSNILPADGWIYNYRNEAGYIPATAGFVTPLSCDPPGVTLDPRDVLCDDGGGMLLSDQTIKNLPPGNILNKELFKKIQYYVHQGDSLLAKGLLQDVDNYLARRLLTSQYQIQADIPALNSQIAILPDTTEEQSNFKQLNQWYADLKQSNRTIYDITASEDSLIRQIAASYTQTAFEARTVLYLVYGEEFSVDLPPLNGLVDSTLLNTININFKSEEPSLSTKNEVGCTLFPNPSKGIVQIDCFNEYEALELSIYSITGTLLKNYTLSSSTIDISHLNNGYYIYQLTATNRLIDSGKLVLLK